jgi:hypothetical protein
MDGLNPNEQLLRASALALYMKIPETLLYDMRAAGCPFPAGRSCQVWVMEWLKENPSFMPIDHRHLPQQTSPAAAKQTNAGDNSRAARPKARRRSSAEVTRTGRFRTS